MRFGILGGTFDPVHFGHLRTAEEVGEIFELKKVYLIPAKKPPHKQGKLITPFSDRIDMLRLAVKGSKKLGVLDIEGRRSGYSYTIDTLKNITSDPAFGKRPDIYFILGIDAFMEIDTWKDYKSLFSYANFVIVKRPGHDDKRSEAILQKVGIEYKKSDKCSFCLRTGKRIWFVLVTFLDISSTQIRELVKHGKSISFLLPERVKDYILKKGLYKNEIY